MGRPLPPTALPQLRDSPQLVAADVDTCTRPADVPGLRTTRNCGLLRSPIGIGPHCLSGPRNGASEWGRCVYTERAECLARRPSIPRSLPRPRSPRVGRRGVVQSNGEQHLVNRHVPATGSNAAPAEAGRRNGVPGCSDSSKRAVRFISSRSLESDAFIEEQASRPALLLVVPSGRLWRPSRDARLCVSKR